MTDDELKALVASLAVSQDRTDEQMKRTDEKLERIGITLGNVTNNQGAVAEEFFYNSLKDSQILAGVHYDFIDKNVSRTGNGVSDEFDMILVNGQDVALVEVKYKAHEEDLTKLLTKKYNNFKILFPAYKDYHHHLVLATFYLYDKLKEQALKNNVIVLQRKGDIVQSFLPVGEVS